MTREQREDRENKFKEQAARNMAGFQYTQIATSIRPEFTGEIWRAAKPGCSAYAFDIAISRFGIAVYGDMDGMLFTVGASYGMEFLAGDDVGYYIHSKLKEDSKRKVFDKSYFLGVVAENARASLSDVWVHGDDDTLPAILADDAGNVEFDQLLAFLREQLAAGVEVVIKRTTRSIFGSTTTDSWELSDIIELIEEARLIDDTRAAYEFMDEHRYTVGCEDLADYNFEMPDDNLIQRLYMVNRAAKAIMEIQREREQVGELVHDAGCEA